LIVSPTATEPARAIAITGEEFLIGRGSDCDFSVQDARMSRHHCLIRVRGHEVTLSDLGAVNGTFVNGQQVRSQVTLHTGDEIRVGSIRLVVALGDMRPPLDTELDESSPTQRFKP